MRDPEIERDDSGQRKTGINSDSRMHGHEIIGRAEHDPMTPDMDRGNGVGRRHVLDSEQPVIGGGGTSAPSNMLFFDPPQCRVITGVGDPDPKTGKRPPVYVHEHAPWSAVRNAEHSYGFAAFTLDPGSHPGDFTTIEVAYYDVVGTDGQLAPFEHFTLRRPRRD